MTLNSDMMPRQSINLNGDNLMKTGWEKLREEWADESPFLRCHTSGSTGKPSDILLPKSEMIRSAARTARYFGLDSDSLLYCCISPDYIGGKMMYVRQQLLDCRLICEPPSNQPLIGADSDLHIDLLSVVPSQTIDILDRLHELPHIGNMLIGGSAIPSELRIRIAQSGMNAYESYGMTETSSHIAIRRVEAEEGYFQCLEGISVSETEGALKIRIEGWRDFLTNDAAEIREDGSFRILGRLDNAIISGGLKIFPEEVEKIISRHISVPFYISSEADSKWGRKVVMVIETDKKFDSSGFLEKLRRKIAEELPPHMIPKDIVAVDKFDYTPNGKIKRK